jgi:hypothetical protein
VTHEEWLARHYEFGFEAAVVGWPSVPSSARKDVSEARQAGFDAGKAAALNIGQLAKDGAAAWVKTYAGKGAL